MTETPLTRFQDLLRELFQFDCADLDFGIYRILNHKRDVIRRFIEEDLPRSVEEELNRGQAAAQERAVRELEARAEEVRSTLSSDALDAGGKLDPAYRETQVGKRYLEAQGVASGARGADDMAAEAFNHLYAFFSRYYEDGDFISKRRYSKEHRYAIPYNGEEVLLHWATADQYYVKSAEYFHDYQFQSQVGVTVRFELQNADVEHDNVKGAHRFFIACGSEASWDGKSRRFTVPFEYRPLTSSEETRYGSKPTDRARKEVLSRAADAIRTAASLHPEVVAALNEPRAFGSGNDTTPALEHHLRQYSRRNTSDFFIHKNLSGFLKRELDFYLKNEVLSLDTLEAGGEQRRAGWFQMMSLVRSVGRCIVAFLGQIEDFQRRLWQKAKFVYETTYIAPVGLVPNLYDDILRVDAQWREWEELGVSVARNAAFLSKNPTLPLDTRHFSEEFTDRLLASLEDLHSVLDGVLVEGENYQALRLLKNKYERSIKCTYIDPPYNAKTSEILYKNTYKHASWLSMMNDRVRLERGFRTDDGVLVCAIDENEQENLGLAFRSIFPGDERVCVSVVHNPRGIQGSGFSFTHEYSYFVYRRGLSLGLRELKDVKSKPLMKTGSESERETGKNCFYPILVRDGRVVGFGAVPADSWHPREAATQRADGVWEVWPISSNGVERKWRYARQTVASVEDALSVQSGRNGLPVVYLGKRRESYRTVWSDADFNAAEYGSTMLKNIFGEKDRFSFPKSLWTVWHALKASNVRDGHLVLDFFAGSGTTGHAVISMNRDDGERRKFILVDVERYFDTVLVSRIKKIMFAPKWKDGRPEDMHTSGDMARGPRLIQCVRIESYEDSLNNIEFNQEAPRLPFEDYELRYMLTTETGGSNTLLNVERLARPFDYRLSVRSNGRVRQRIADLPETFNFLIGLRVRTRRAIYRRRNGGRCRYLVVRGETRIGKETVVLWRDIEGWTEDDFEHEWTWVRERDLTKGADVVYVNGDSVIEGARSLDSEFKRRMFEDVAV